MLEDNKNDAELIQEQLRLNFQEELVFEIIEDEVNFLKCLDVFKPDIILCDYILPFFDAIKALEIAVQIAPLTPFIIVTGAITDEAAAESVKNGAWDYVVKERLNRLPRAIKNSLKLKVEKEKTQKAQQEIFELKNLYQTIFENTGTATIIFDENGTIFLANKKFEILSGYKRHEIENKLKWMVFVDEQDLNKMLTYHKNRRVGEGEAPNQYEFTFISKDKTKKNILLTVDVIKETGNSVASLLDITEIKKNQLELIEAKEKADEGSRLKSSFLANVSHELRTPLNAIIGFSSLMNNGMSLDRVVQLATLINSSGSHLLEIIDSLICISKLQARMEMFDPKSFKINDVFDVIDAKIEEKADQYPHKEIKFFKKVDSQLLNTSIFSDKNKIINVVDKFIVNAIVYSQTLKIEYGAKIEDNSVIFYVKDEGIGIHKSMQDLIFQPFRQVDELCITKETGGIGLGLAICKETANLISGEVFVESEPGIGSTFFLKLSIGKK